MGNEGGVSGTNDEQLELKETGVKKLRQMFLLGVVKGVIGS